MKLRYLQFASILFWGYKADLLIFALPIALILEARFFTDRRWALTRQDFYRVADLTGVGLVGLLLFLFMNRTEYHFITTLIQWLPILFFPLVTVLAYSTTERMPLDVIFYSLRRQQDAVTQSWDMAYVYFGLCIVAAGTTRQGETWYLPVAALLIFSALFQLRPARYRGSIWLLAVLTMFLGGTMFHQTLRSAHLELQEQSRRWLANFIEARTNPLKTKSAIGTIGRLKTSDEIEFRVKPMQGSPSPGLLQEATYDSPSGTDWLVLNPQFSVVTPVNDFTWRFQPRARGEHRATVYLEFDRETALVPIPANTSEIFDLPALDIKQSRFGSIQALGLIPSPGFEIAWQGQQVLNSPPDRSDLFIPPEYGPTLAQLLPEHTTDPVARVHELFQGFSYSLYQDIPAHQDPLIHFLTEGHKGHCEYFASGAVLALRQLGVPARYAVGYSVQEYNDAIDMYIVRKRHAHAWAIAWINDEWRIVDTTPQVWADEEASQANPLRPVADAFANGLFVVQLWWSEQQLEDYETELYVIGAILVVILIWRIATSEQVRLNRGTPEHEKNEDFPGRDSPFFLIEQYLSDAGFSRQTSEPFENWIQRIRRTELAPLLAIHNRLRFDPRGVDASTRRKLDDNVRQWLSHQPIDDASRS